MRTYIDIKPEILLWAIHRLGADRSNALEKNPMISDWIKGNKKPTIKQLKNFSKSVYVPFGFLVAGKKLDDEVSIPFFRSGKNSTKKLDINIIDSILLLEQKQTRLKEYLIENEYDPLSFIGSYKNSLNEEAIVSDIRAKQQQIYIGLKI